MEANPSGPTICTFFSVFQKKIICVRFYEKKSPQSSLVTFLNGLVLCPPPTHQTRTYTQHIHFYMKYIHIHNLSLCVSLFLCLCLSMYACHSLSLSYSLHFSRSLSILAYLSQPLCSYLSSVISLTIYNIQPFFISPKI